MSGSLLNLATKLGSGAKVRAALLPNTHREVIVIYLRTGSRYEALEQSGLSHFLEHMLFRGTASHKSAHLLATAFEDLGGTLEATTGTDYGTLGISVPPESFSETLAHLAEVVKAPLLIDLEAERNIISEEILEDLDDQGRLIHALSVGRALAFPGHGMGRLITGPLENLQRFSETDLRQHHQRTYVGAGLAIAVAGPIAPETALGEIERRFAQLSAGSPLIDAAPPRMAGPHFEYVPHKGSSQTRVYVAFRTTGYFDPQDAALEMLLRILDDGLSTRLYHRLCDESGLCYDVQGSYEAFSDSGIVEIIADTAHDRAPRVLEKILGILNDLAEHGPEERELERARRRARWQHLAVLDDPGEIADYLAFSSLSGTAAVPDQRLEELLAVTKEAIVAAARALGAPTERVVVAVGQQKPAVLEKLRAVALSGNARG
jgi:predicted Zn-dependent peptidase